MKSIVALLALGVALTAIGCGSAEPLPSNEVTDAGSSGLDTFPEQTQFDLGYPPIGTGDGGTPTTVCTCPTGCCDDNGLCQLGTSLSLCGGKGDTCRSCVVGSKCIDHKCTIDAAQGQYEVVLVSATLTSCGFLDGKCDGYVKLTVGTLSAQSAKKGNTNSPAWNQALMITTGDELKKSFKVEVKDADVLSDSTLGTCIPVITDAILSAGKLIVDCGSKVKALTFNFTPKL